MSFIDQKPHIATERDCKGSWLGGKNGKYFRCQLCGHKFVPGDIYRWIYCGDIKLTNIIVCEKCDGEDVKEKWLKTYRESKDRFWWLWAEIEKCFERY